MIGDRSGSFPDMAGKKTFQVVLVSPHRPTGYLNNPRPDKTLDYAGKRVEIPFSKP